MKEGPDISRIAALIGNPASANMLMALMAGPALTATELAQEGGIGLPTTSEHLAKLEKAGLVSIERQGRHRYYRLADHDVATALEGLMPLAERAGHRRTRTGPRDPELRREADPLRFPRRRPTPHTEPGACWPSVRPVPSCSDFLYSVKKSRNRPYALPNDYVPARRTRPGTARVRYPCA